MLCRRRADRGAGGAVSDELFAGAFAGFVGVGAGLPECRLQPLDTVPDGIGVQPEVAARGVEQAGERGDQLARLIEVDVVWGGALRQAELFSGGTCSGVE
ncbi:hypothetical protein GCM10010528_15630 [Gordonia defluvii]|uniref:Uncharacterized protein n=1 Tax=Gordonia defluvii TaxID=283718 RepID=A0ABP6L868_9ACTN